jgi:hypothetical protein
MLLRNACYSMLRRPRIVLGDKWLLRRRKKNLCELKYSCEGTSASARAKRNRRLVPRTNITGLEGGETHSTPELGDKVILGLDLGR